MAKKSLLSKLFSIFLVIVIISSSIQMTTYAEETNERVAVTLSMYSNKTNETTISGYYQNNIFYVSVDDLCKIVDGKTDKTSDSHLTLSLNNGFRKIYIDNGGNIEEVFNSVTYKINIPVIKQDSNLFISLLHFLNYIGASYELDKASDPQLMVAVRYNLFDAMQELHDTKNGNFFSWEEVECEGMDIEDFLINAGVIALINRDSNIFRMIFDAKGIEQEAIEDALVSIIKNEGNKYFDDSNSFLDFYNTATDLYSMTADFVKFIAKTYSTDATKDVADLMNDYAENSSDGLGEIANVLNALESYKQFDSISEAERMLLENTIIASPEASDTLCDGWENVLKAAENVNDRAKSAYSNQYKSALQVVNDTCYDKLGSIDSPVLAAWNGIILINKIIPYTSNMIDKKTQLYNAYLCSMIQFIANDLLSYTYSDVYYSNFYCKSSSEQQENFERLKYNLILQLKSTLTTREYLIESGFLDDDYTKEMEEMNKATAELLNKTENCYLVGVGDFYDTEYSDDYSWIAEFKDNTQLYYDYIENNLDVIDSTDFPKEDNKKQGVFSALIDDFNNDGDKEMITASIVIHASRQEYVVFDLYEIENGKVVKCDKTKEFFASGAGNFSNEFCATYENKKLKLQYVCWSYGGSSHSEEYATISIKNNQFDFVNDYSINEFYRTNQYEYQEVISGEEFSSISNIREAIGKSDYTNHQHVTNSSSTFDFEKNDYDTNETFKGKHIFTLVNSNALITDGLYGFLHDNTDLVKKISKSTASNSSMQISQGELKAIHEAAVDFYGEHIYGPCEYQDFEHQINNGELTLTKYGDIDTYAEFLEEAKKHFTEETAINILKSISAQDYNGKLYTVTNPGVGSVLMGEELSIKKISNSKYRVTSTYQWPGNRTSTASRNIVYENGKWVLDDANFEF